MSNKEWLGTKIMGIGSSEAIDTAGEKVILSGIDITTLASTGTLNWEHLNANSSQCVGKIIEAKKIFTESDCENKDHLLLFEKNNRKPYLFIKGILFDAFKHEGSLAIASILKFDEAYGSPDKERVINFSIEGSRLDTDKNGIVHRCIARKIAVTTQACNKQSFAMLCDDLDEDASPKKETEDLKSLLQSVFKKSEEEYQELSKGELKSQATQQMIAARKEKGMQTQDKFQQKIGPAKTAATGSDTVTSSAPKTTPKNDTAKIISGSAFKDKIEAARKHKTVDSSDRSNVVSIKSKLTAKKSNNMRSTLLKNAKSGISALSVEHLDKEMHKAINDDIYNRFDKKEELLAVIENKYPHMNGDEILFLAKSTTYAMEKRAENYLESLIKGVGQLEFNSLPKMKGRPSSDVRTIENPMRSADLVAHVASNKERQHTGKKNKDSSPASYLPGITEPGDEGGSFRSHNKKGVIGKPTSFTHLGASNEVINHEALHGTLANLSNKHGLNQQQMGSVHNHFLNMMHPYDVKTIQSHMVNNGYDINDPNHHEELLAHVHQAVGGTRDNESSLSLDKQRKKTGLTQKPNLGAQAPKTGLEGKNRNFNKTRLRDSWNLIREHASKMDEGKLHQIANANIQPDYKNYKKSEEDTDDEPENLPKLLKPFKSKAQLGYLMSHKEKIGGEKGAEEWLEHTDIKSLPEKVKKKK